jgi:hypothetical protein
MVIIQFLGKLLPKKWYLRKIRNAVKRKIIDINKLPFELCLRLVHEEYISLYNISSDELFTKVYYTIKTKRILDLENVQTLNEKINWLKLYDRKPEYTTYADKYRVRKHIENTIGKKYLIPLLRVYHSIDDFTVQDLPTAPFIIKTNHFSGEVIVVRDKKKFNFEKAKEILKWQLSLNFYDFGREHMYKNIKSCILVEKLLLDKNDKIPIDYKFHCFHGKVEFVYCSIDRENKNYRKIYKKNWEKTNITLTVLGGEKKFLGSDIPMPQNYQEMIKIAEKLAAPFVYVRIDLYNVEGRIYFGEITLYPGCGCEVIIPREMDYYYGSLIKLPPKIAENVA